MTFFGFFKFFLIKSLYQKPGFQIPGKGASEGPEPRRSQKNTIAGGFDPKNPEQISGLTVLGCSFLKPFNLFAVDPPRDSVQPGRFSIFTAAVQAKR